MTGKKLTDAGISAFTTPTDDDLFYAVDAPGSSPASKKITWSNIKATLKTYLDTLYPPNSGWITGSGTWAYSSADSPTFIISINADVTALIGVGDRIKLTQTTAKYFIVTAVGAYSGGNTLVTVYGGTDYTLANAAITSPFYSHSKSPFGFPVSPAKWTVTLTDSSDRAQASPTQNTWYNMGSQSISIPIGSWNVSMKINPDVQRASAGAVNVVSTLSTANNSESDAQFSVGLGILNTTEATGNLFMRKNLLLASKTTYYVNTRTTQASMSSINILNSFSNMLVEAVCAYL